MDFYLYILQSLKDKGSYVGIARDVESRLKQHNSGKTPSIKSRRPFKLIYKERHSSRTEARYREKYLKSYAGVQEKRKILESFSTIGE